MFPPSDNKFISPINLGISNVDLRIIRWGKKRMHDKNFNEPIKKNVYPLFPLRKAARITKNLVKSASIVERLR